MKKIRSFFVLLVTALLVGSAVYYVYDGQQASSASQQKGSKKVTLKIAYLPITHALPLFKAKELLEKQEGVQIKLVKYGGWSELMDALNTGRVDGASVLIEMAMKAKEQGIPLELTALGHRNGNVVITALDIKSSDQLVDKTFAIPNQQSSHNILMRELLEENGIDQSQVNFVEMAPAEMPAALQSGQIDGYCVAEPFGAKGVEAGIGRVYATSESLWKDSICCGIVLNTSAVEGNEAAVKIFEEAYKEAGNILTEEEAEEIAEKYLGQNKEICQLSLQWISFDNLDVTQKAYQTLTDKMKEFGLSENPPTYQEFVEN